MNTAKKDQLLKELDDQSIAKVEIDSMIKEKQDISVERML